MLKAVTNILTGFALWIAISASAHAGMMGFNFQYEFGSGEIFSGMLEGELQPDLNTVIVSDLLMASYSGLPGVGFQTELMGSSSVVTFSGTGNDFGTIAPTGGLAAFVMPFNFQLTSIVVISTESNIGFANEIYNPERWSLSPKTIPVPATIWLFGIAAILLYRQRAPA